MSKTPSSIDKIVETSSYKQAYKKLKKDHRNDVLDDLKDIIGKLSRFEITTQASNHPLKGIKDAKDIHVRGDVLLIYRYVNNSLVIDLELLDLVNHKELKNSKKQKQLKKKVNSSLEEEFVSDEDAFWNIRNSISNIASDKYDEVNLILDNGKIRPITKDELKNKFAVSIEQASDNNYKSKEELEKFANETNALKIMFFVYKGQYGGEYSFLYDNEDIAKKIAKDYHQKAYAKFDENGEYSEVLVEELKEEITHMTFEELKALAEELNKFLEEQQAYYEVYPEDDDTISADISWGDWKHDHLWFDHVAEKFFNEKGYDVVNVNVDVTDEDGSDTYSAIHSLQLRKHEEEPKEYKMVDSNSVKVEDESLCEEDNKDALKKERDELWSKMPDCTKDEIQRLIDIRKELGDDEFYTENITREALKEDNNSKVRLENPKLVSWKEMYLNDVCGGDEDQYNELYADMWEEDEEFGDSPCQVFYDVVDDEGHYLGKLGVYKFDMQTWVYEVGFEPNERYLNKDKLELQDLDLPVDGWFDNEYNHKDLRSEEEYRKVAEQFLPKIENAIEYSYDDFDEELSDKEVRDIKKGNYDMDYIDMYKLEDVKYKDLVDKKLISPIKVLYHATTKENWEKIQKEGLKINANKMWNVSHNNCIYLAVDADDALGYVEVARDWGNHDSQKFVLLSVLVDDLDLNELYVDTNEEENGYCVDNSLVLMTLEYRKDIPITIIKKEKEYKY